MCNLFIFFVFWLFFFFLWGEGGETGSHSVAQMGLNSASTSQVVLGFQACATTPSSTHLF
jgi:hypothetical protein